MTVSINGSTGITFPNGTTEVGRLLNVRTFTTANNGQTYTPTTGTSRVIVEIIGGGGAGGGALATSSTQYCLGYGGASGAYAKAFYTSGFSGVTLTIGSGGSGVSAASGNPGGASSFGSLVACAGGSGGSVGTLRTNSTVYIDRGSNIADLFSVSGTGILYTHLGFSGDTLSQSGSSWIAGGGASTLLGTGGTQMGGSANGWAGIGYGSGGSGASNGISSTVKTGGTGSDGLIIVWEYA